MPQPKRKKRKVKVPSRSARYARSPKPSKTAEDQYSLALRRLVREWAKVVRKEVLPAAKAVTAGTRQDAKDPKGAGKKLSAAAKRLANASSVGKAIDKAAKTTDKHTRKELIKLGISPDKTPGLTKLFKNWRKSNVSLIRRFLDTEAEKMTTLLEGSFGRRFESVAKDIQERLGVTSRRADLIARDQSLSLNAQIAKSKQEAAGISEYIWTSAGDAKVRDLHTVLDGQRFKFSEPPVSSADGSRGHPGEPINCRCTQYPVIPALDD